MRDPLSEALRAQQTRGVLGPGPVEDHVAHALRMADLVDAPPSRAVDLGSGGGVPGLVMAAECWPGTSWLLVDASRRRCTYLELVVADLGLDPRVEVHWGRAEEAGRDPSLRARHDLVVSRSFGPPPVVAECGAPLLRVGGHLVVSEPPDGPGDRWDATGLDRTGLVLDTSRAVDGSWFTRLRQVRPCPDELPRRPGVPARKPLF